SSTWGSFTVNSFTWDNNAMTVYEGDPVDSYILHNDSNNPSKDGYYANLMWDENYEAILIKVYVKAKPSEDTLKVIYYDEKFGDELYTYNINVKPEVTFDAITPEPGAFSGNAERIDVTGCGIKNSLGVTQNFQTDLTKVPEAVGKYNSALYDYTGSVISKDKKTLYLYYTINPEALSPNYVVDFGLPITFGLDAVVTKVDTVESVTVSQETRLKNILTYDSSTREFTYTPINVLTGTDVLTINILFAGNSDPTTTNVGVTPASNVLYEDGFLTETTESRVKWSGETGKGTVTQTTGKGHVDVVEDSDPYVYGYDPAYSTSTGNSNGTAWTVSGLGSTAQSTNALTTTFKGNGFDLIGSCGPTTGLVYVVLKDLDNKAVKGAVIDTSFNDSNVGETIHQVPLAHLMLDTEDTYTATIRGYYRKGTTAESGTSAASTFSARASTVDTSVLDAVLEDIYEDDLDDLEMIYFDSDSVLAAYNGAAMYALDDGSDTDTTSTTVEKKDGITVTIDGFRVYKGTNEAYISSEQGVTYTNVLDATMNPADSEEEVKFVAYIENRNGEYTQSTYEAAGGPQNEIYLAKDQSVAFAVTSQTPIQISARAVSSTAAEMVVNGATTGENLASNTEMYYEITPVNNVVTIKNTGGGLLALGNLKMQKTKTTLRAMTDSDLQVAYAMLRTMSVEPEPEPEPEPEVFTPDKFDIKVTSTKVIRNKVVNLTVTTSTDVEYLMVNGKKVKPSNSLLVKWGISKNYVFVVSDIVKRDAVQNYTIQAYNADGLASVEYTAEG
ncbi:MAG: hypothetical protein ACI4PV_03160, partial [Butyricicoccus sp.]